VLDVGPSVLKVPSRGCWRLTLHAGPAITHLTVLQVLSEQVLPQRGMAFAPPSGVGLPGGSKMAMMAPPRGPQKRLLCRGKSVGGRDSRPLGSGMDSSGLASHTREVLAQRGRGLRPPSRRSACQGSKMAMMAPSGLLTDSTSTAPTGRRPRPPPITASACRGSKMAMMAPSRGPRGKGLGSVIHVLWGPDGLVWLFFHGGHKYCHDGGMALAHHLTTRGFIPAWLPAPRRARHSRSVPASSSHARCSAAASLLFTEYLTAPP